jgi:AraC-like DNA-binding protein
MFLYFLLITIGLLGLLTVLVVLTRYKSNRMMNIYLIITFILVSFRFILHGANYFLSFKNSDDLIINYNRFFIILIPCLYLYLDNLILDRKFFALQDFKHFIIPILFFLLVIKMNNTGNSLSLKWKLTSFVLFSTYAFAYCYLCYSMLLKKVWLKKETVRIQNKQNRLIKKWTLFLVILSTLSIIRVLISLYFHIFNKDIISISDEYFIWISGLIWMLIFIKTLISPEVLYGYDVLNDIIKKEKTYTLELDNIWDIESKKESYNIQDSKLKLQVDKNIIEYISEIEKKALNPTLFKDFKFTISDLATKLKIPTSHLNYIFKYHCKISFSDYKKTIRIHHSINLIQSGYLEINTFESLAKEVGFASYNPFYSSFKEISGKSPKEFIDKFNA